MAGSAEWPVLAPRAAHPNLRPTGSVVSEGPVAGKPGKLPSEFEGSQLVFGIHSHIIRAAFISFHSDLADQVFPVGAGVLFQDGQEVDEGRDRGAWRAEEAVADAIGAVLHETLDRRIGKQVPGGVPGSVYVADLPQKQVEVFHRQ